LKILKHIEGGMKVISNLKCDKPGHGTCPLVLSVNFQGIRSENIGSERGTNVAQPENKSPVILIISTT
jgi:hypothetical protein